MSRFLLIDIGAGTMDLLYYDSGSGMHYKAVVKSPVPLMAQKAADLPGNLLVTGVEMGGGDMSAVLKSRAQENEVFMTLSSSATIHHNPERVRSLGIVLIEDSEAQDPKFSKGYSRLVLSDLNIDRLREITEGMGVPFLFDIVGICAQDHGVPPLGLSHLDYRHNIFKAILDKTPSPHAILYKADEVPSTMNRLRSLAESAKMLPVDEIYVMDSGIAAILGASMDPSASQKERIMVLDVATSHTVGATMDKGEIAGFFEYHTSEISLERLESLLIELADGRLEHKKILEEGGHGAYIRKAIGYQEAEIIVATGPKRSLIENSRLPITLGAPLGDNMMTGTVGLLEAIRRHNDLEPFSYL